MRKDGQALAAASNAPARVRGGVQASTADPPVDGRGGAHHYLWNYFIGIIGHYKIIIKLLSMK